MTPSTLPRPMKHLFPMLLNTAGEVADAAHTTFVVPVHTPPP